VRLLAVLLTCLALPLGLWLALPLGGDAATPAQIQERIESTRDRIDRRRGTERDLSRDISRWSDRIRRLETRIGGLQRREATLQADLDAKRAELVQIQERLREERARLARLRARLIVTRRQLAARLVEIYQADKPDVLSVILNSRGFAELLERQEFIGRIAAQDRRIVEIVRTARADAASTTRRLDRLERRQQRLTAIVLQRRNEVAQVKQELIGTRVGYQRTRAGKATALRRVRSQRVELQEDLRAMEAQQARIQARLRAAAATAGGGGGGNGPGAGPIRRGSGSLIWPANGPVSSPFGQRWGRLHAGIDIPLPEGTPLRAADSGRVAIAGWVGGYGQYTCIQHNASLSTCYAHQSSLGVSVGQSVSQGQVIGRSGNTGNSTGPHLHFEVRVGGSPVDPLGYL
jgi:murein DD-endopeptidase MepM/ murein hydrolase activator NlpD